jgi:hypothetical protein
MDIYWTRSNAPASDSLDNCIGISSHQKASVRFDAWAGGSTRARLACALGIPSIQCQTRREHQGSGKSCAKSGSVTASASRSPERSYQLNERQCLGALHPLEIARHLNLRRIDNAAECRCVVLSSAINHQIVRSERSVVSAAARGSKCAYRRGS